MSFNMQMFSTSQEPIILYREEIREFLRFPKPLGTQVMCDLGAKMGLRSGEIVTLKVEYIDFERGLIRVFDVKDKKFYTLPMGYDLGKELAEFTESRTEGWLFESKKKQGTHMTVEGVWQRLKKSAKASGVLKWEGFSPRTLRHFFAADWVERGGNLEMLRRMLRHKNLAHTQIYLSKLVFFEDLQAEYANLHEIPNLKARSPFYRKWCALCVHDSLCKFKEEALSSPWASGCRHFVTSSSSVASVPVQVADHRKLIVLVTLAMLIKTGRESISMGEMESAYVRFCKAEDQTPLGHTQLWKHLTDLSKDGILETRLSNVGRRGKTTLISSSLFSLQIRTPELEKGKNLPLFASVSQNQGRAL